MDTLLAILQGGPLFMGVSEWFFGPFFLAASSKRLPYWAPSFGHLQKDI